MKTRIEIGVMLPQVKRHKKLPETRRNKEEFSTRTSGDRVALAMP